MKTIPYLMIIILGIMFNSCLSTEDGSIDGKFEDMNDNTIFNYLLQNKESYSSFIALAESGGVNATLSAYNPYGLGYTLFLPNNDAIDQFIKSSNRFASLNDLLKDKEYAKAFCEYHVVNMAVNSNSFPFGAFSEPTLSGDYLTVSFVIEEDSSYYKINNSAVVYNPNLEVSNGFIHPIKSVLTPVTFTTYEWLSQNSDYSIFKDAVDITGLQSIIDFNLKESENALAVSLFVEPDSIFNKNGIFSVEDLIQYISPSNNDYANLYNPLYGYVAYHMLSGNYFIDDFIDKNTVYSTFSDVPLNIDGRGLDIAINKGKQVFDTIVHQSDTTYVDFIKFKYDYSNVLTQCGAIHIIDQVMTQEIPSRAQRNFEFYEEPVFYDFRQLGGTFIVDENSLSTINWTGGDLFFVDLGSESNGAWNNDYLEISGDFSIAYRVPKIIQGKYNVSIRAEAFSRNNALIEVFIDNKKIGSIIDLTKGGSSNNPFQSIKLGAINFTKYAEHTIEIRPLIPGRLVWDAVQFEPI